MATTRNLHKASVNSNGEPKLLLDELIPIQDNGEHTSIPYGDMLIYVHEKSHCHNNCKSVTAVKCKKNRKNLRQKLMAKIEVKGE
jgi:hypothetical protein